MSTFESFKKWYFETKQELDKLENFMNECFEKVLNSKIWVNEDGDRVLDPEDAYDVEDFNTFSDIVESEMMKTVPKGSNAIGELETELKRLETHIIEYSLQFLPAEDVKTLRHSYRTNYIQRKKILETALKMTL